MECGTPREGWLPQEAPRAGRRVGQAAERAPGEHLTSRPGVAGHVAAPGAGLGAATLDEVLEPLEVASGAPLDDAQLVAALLDQGPRASERESVLEVVSASKRLRWVVKATGVDGLPSVGG